MNAHGCGTQVMRDSLNALDDSLRGVASSACNCVHIMPYKDFRATHAHKYFIDEGFTLRRFHKVE